MDIEETELGSRRDRESPWLGKNTLAILSAYSVLS